MPKKNFLLFLFLIIIFISCLAFWRFSFIIFNSKATPTFLSPFVNPLPITYHVSPITSIVAVGDIMLGRNVNKKMHEYNDFLYPFKKVADFTSKANITFANLESPFFDKCPVVGSGTFTFCGDYRSIEGLKLAGFDVLSLANNHILNYGDSGLKQTADLLAQNNISFTNFDPSSKYYDNIYYYSEPAVREIDGQRFGFLAFNLTFGLKPQIVIEKTKEQIDKVDVLIVSLHWGEEYKPKPAKWQVDLAHQLIDSGVKVILGHHSHVIGEYERYNDGLIFYSLGNFVFDQMWSQETREGLVVKINFEGKEIKDYQTYPVLISDYSQPDFIEN